MQIGLLVASILDSYILPGRARLPRLGASGQPKPVVWIAESLEDLRARSEETRREAGYQLGRLQLGKMPDDWKPFTLVGPGTIEIRIHKPHEHRVIVVVSFEEAVYVLHVFGKKARKTPKHEIELCKRRYRALLMERRTK